MKRWIQAAIFGLATASLVGAPAFAKAEVEELSRIHVSRLPPEDIAPHALSLRPRHLGTTQRDGLLCLTEGRARASLGTVERQGADAAPMTSLTWGVVLISISAILLTCALLLEELLRRRFWGRAGRNFVGSLRNQSEIYWGAEVTIATVFVVAVWTMLSASAFSGAPAPGSSHALEELRRG